MIFDDLKRQEAYEKILIIGADKNRTFDGEFHQYLKTLFFPSLKEEHANVVFDNLKYFLDWFNPNKRQFIDEFLKVFKDIEQKKLITEFQKNLQITIEKHSRTLFVKRMQLIRKDAYGIEKGKDKWEDEVVYFILNIVRPPSYIKFNSIDYLQEIENCLDKYSSELEYLSIDIENMSGLDFEIYCQNILLKDGWNVIRNGKAGDQGVDLIASLGVHKAAIQCKRYTATVGNKAVQEIAAGMKFEACTVGVVVTTSSFTKSAKQLAHVIGIKLIHYSELSNFKNIIIQYNRI